MENRLIKFRAYDTINNIMKDAAFVQEHFNMMDLCNSRFAIMQFAGLLDKNKKEIYEGDICDDGYGNLCKIEWQQDKCQFMAIFGEDSSEQFQEIGEWCIIIGNIYENPIDTLKKT